MAKIAAEHLDARVNPEARYFEFNVIKIAAEIMKEAGKMGSMAYHLADAMTKRATVHWSEEFSEFAEICANAIGAEVIRHKLASDASGESSLTMPETKAAMSKVILGLVGEGAAMSPEAVKALLGLSIGAGATVGGIGWKLNRDTQQGDADLEAMQAKTDAYDRISNDIQNDVNSRRKRKQTAYAAA